MDKEELINRIEGRLICRPRNQCERDRNVVLTELAVDVKQSLSGYVIAPEGWAKVAVCPDHNCTDGVVAHYYGDGSGGETPEISQCQFCYEKAAMLAAREG